MILIVFTTRAGKVNAPPVAGPSGSQDRKRKVPDTQSPRKCFTKLDKFPLTVVMDMSAAVRRSRSRTEKDDDDDLIAEPVPRTD